MKKTQRILTAFFLLLIPAYTRCAHATFGSWHAIHLARKHAKEREERYQQEKAREEHKRQADEEEYASNRYRRRQWEAENEQQQNYSQRSFSSSPIFHDPKRLAKYLIFCPLWATQTAKMDHEAEQRTKPESDRMPFELRPVQAIAKELVAEVTADFLYDTINAAMDNLFDKEVYAKGDAIMQSVVAYALHAGLYNITRNAVNGFKNPKLYSVAFECVVHFKT